MKLCTQCKHAIIVPNKQGLYCKHGVIRSPIDGGLYSCRQMRMMGVVGYVGNGTEMSGLVSCTPAGHWWEPVS